MKMHQTIFQMRSRSLGTESWGTEIGASLHVTKDWNTFTSSNISYTYTYIHTFDLNSSLVIMEKFSVPKMLVASCFISRFRVRETGKFPFRFGSRFHFLEPQDSTLWVSFTFILGENLKSHNWSDLSFSYFFCFLSEKNRRDAMSMPDCLCDGIYI